MQVECKYKNECGSSKNLEKCRTCENNRKRNFVEDFYAKCEDNPIPEDNPKLRYIGPIEQTAGYECPVCGGYTNPYHINRGNPICEWCGFKLNI